MHPPATNLNFKLPCVVQLGFAGSRQLVEALASGSSGHPQFHEQVQRDLQQRLARLPEALGMASNQFLCGISQVAIGADMLFTRACRELKIPQRIFLPQNRHDYLTAGGSDGSLDFSPEQRREAEQLLAADHIIQERVVSHSADRTARFEDTNLEILRVSDVVVCLLREDAVGKPGGTNQLLAGAIARQRPTLELRVTNQNGQAVVSETWHNLQYKPPRQLCAPLHEAPAVPGAPLPSCGEFTATLKQFASEQAKSHQRLFRFAALIIILTHVFATVLATAALASHDVFAAILHADEDHGPVNEKDGSAAEDDQGRALQIETALIAILLAIELALLLGGLYVHHKLHHSEASRNWALSRLLAEICRSVQSLGKFHLYLDYLFARSLPAALRPLLRTLNVLHLRSTWSDRDRPWKTLRDEYVHRRLQDERSGQIHFFQHKRERAGRWRKIAHAMFMTCSLAAIGATATKLLVVLALHDEKLTAALLGALAIVLPVLAVAALSLSAALDLRALEHTYAEVQQFLELQLPLIQNADSRREFELLLLETESQLLGEIAHWFSRRSFLSVT